MKLKGKVAFVTGGGKGIGSGISVELARQGCKVGVNYNSSEEAAKETMRQIEEVGGEAILLKGNIANLEEIQSMIRQTAEAFGGLDFLVNNAALQLNTPLPDYTDDGYDLLMSVNLKGYFQSMQTAVPYMIKRGGGKIVNISSVHGKRPTDFDPVYAMTKGAIKMLTREAALEFAEHNISVNTITPGYIEIGVKSGHPKAINAKSNTFVPPAERKVDRKRTPVGKIGYPADVAYLVNFLCSDEASMINGAHIRLDGGSMLT